MNCVVTKHNFQSELEGIKKTLSTADFIAIDAKLNKYPPITHVKQSSYVTAEEQYLSISENINTLFIMQFDITAFKFKSAENKYLACTYIFYLFRRYVPKPNPCIEIQSSVFSSLQESQFPFDTFFKDGITYLNEDEEEQLNSDMSLYMTLPPKRKEKKFYLTLTDDMQDVLNNTFAEILIWLKTDCIDLLVLDELDYTNELFIYLAVREINSYFHNVWAYYVTNLAKQTDHAGKIVVKKVNDLQRRHEDVVEGKNNNNTLNKYFANRWVGFSHLFRFLTTCKKPIIGHDILTNLMIMYNLFYKPLPNNYDEFKVNLHALFPNVYDTRFLSYELQERMKLVDLWESNGMDDLYHFLKESYGTSEDVSYLPTIKQLDKFDGSVSDKDMFIESEGRNKSFQVGYCFIKMMHILGRHNNSIRGIDADHSKSLKDLSAFEEFKNCIYLSLGNISHVRLDGPDQMPEHSHWILVKPAERKSVIDYNLLTQHCTNTCTFVIVRRILKEEALLGTNTQAGMQSLIKSMNTMQAYKIVPYKCPVSDLTVRKWQWPSVLGLLFAGVGAWVILTLFKKKMLRK